MKYDSLLGPVNNLLPQTKAVLIALSNNPTIDALASGLALFLSLQNSGKNVSIVSESTILVGHSNLFGIGEIKNQLPSTGTGGNFTLTLGGVMGQDNKPVLEGVNYSMQGSDLKLVFPVTMGKRYEPTFITPKFEGGNFDLIITVGVSDLNQIGNSYQQNQQLFNSSQILNIDNSTTNSQFGTIKVIDPQASTVSEMVLSILTSLNLPLERDIASNLLTGISGNMSSSMDTPVQQTVQSVPVSTPDPVQTSTTGGFDITQLYKPGGGVLPGTDAPSTHEAERTNETTASGMEADEPVTPEDDWLTPKIYSGKSVG